MEVGNQRDSLLSILHGSSTTEGELSSGMEVFGSDIRGVRSASH